MTAATVTRVSSHADTAGFRGWGKAISDLIAASGITKTTDTGQIDWATVAKPATSVVGGYEIYSFNDPLQATRPIFIKIEYGTADSVNAPSFLYSIGTGSTGTGALTGVFFTQTIAHRNSSFSTANNPSYVCYNAALGYFAVIGMTGEGASSPHTATNPFTMLGFVVMRPCDDSNAPVNEGLMVENLNTTSWLGSTWSFVTNAFVDQSTRNYCLVPFTGNASAVGTDISVYRHYCATPRVRNLPGVVTYLKPEIGVGATFQLTLGGVARSYMPLSEGVSNASVTNSITHCLAIMYQ